MPPDEKASTCAVSPPPGVEFFARHGIQIHEVMTDNAKNYNLCGGVNALPRMVRRPSGRTFTSDQANQPRNAI